MKEHVPTIALVVSLTLVLAALVILSLHGTAGTDNPVLLGLVAAAGTLAGILGGFSQQPGRSTQPPGMTSQKTTETVVETPLKEKTL